MYFFALVFGPEVDDVLFFSKQEVAFQKLKHMGKNLVYRSHVKKYKLEGDTYVPVTTWVYADKLDRIITLKE
jgi:hypothetical protein